MKNFLLLIAVSCAPHFYSQPNCAAPSTSFVPINDLGAATFTTQWNAAWQGGLYPNGSNFLPQAHKSAGLSLAAAVVPKNAAGNTDTINGKIVWLSIGMSNTTMESQKFIPLANAFPQKNPKLLLVDGAQGGQSASIISAPWDPGYNNYWNTVNNRLAQAGASNMQVQVIWFKEADQATKYSNVHAYYDSLMVMIPRIMNDLRVRFPNLKLCYMASRISARYASSGLNPEPYAYYTGWAVKKVIENQINGDPQLQFSGSSPNAPWLSWGIYMWSDGIIPQATNNKIFWDCSTDYASDGTHPSTAGQQKVAGWLLDFFSTDSTAVPWFLIKSGVVTAAAAEINTGDPLKIYQDANMSTLVEIPAACYTAPGCRFVVSDLLGRKIKSAELFQNPLLRFDLPAGVYYYQLLKSSGVMQSEKFIVH